MYWFHEPQGKININVTASAGLKGSTPIPYQEPFLINFIWATRWVDTHYDVYKLMKLSVIGGNRHIEKLLQNTQLVIALCVAKVLLCWHYLCVGLCKKIYLSLIISFHSWMIALITTRPFKRTEGLLDFRKHYMNLLWMYKHFQALSQIDFPTVVNILFQNRTDKIQHVQKIKIW